MALGLHWLPKFRNGPFRFTKFCSSKPEATCLYFPEQEKTQVFRIAQGRAGR